MATRLPRLRLDDQLCFALYAATNAVTRAYKPLLGKLGLTYPQYLVMLVLWQDGATSPNDIATRLQLGASAITPLLDQLEKSGFVARARSSTDRRRLIVAATPTGAALYDLAAVAQDAIVCRTGLSDTGLHALRDELNAMVDRIAAFSGMPTNEPD